MIQKRRLAKLLLLFTAMVFFRSWQPFTCSGADGSGNRGLKVTVSYTGKGAVDAEHRLHVLVFDTSYIGHVGTSPILSASLAQNGKTASFTGIPVSPVFVAVFYDKDGGYKGGAEGPASGAPGALYGKEPGMADPIEIAEGSTVQIQVTFDDSLVMP